MSSRSKLILRIILFVGITALLAYGVYFMIFRPDLRAPAIPTDDPATDAGNLPTSPDATGTRIPDETSPTDTTQLPTTSPVAQGGPTLITRLTESKILAPAASGANSALYYDANDGYFYRVGRNGALEQYSDAAFPSAERVTFDDRATNAVLEFPDGSNVIYNFASNRQITMPPHWSEFSFSPGGTALAGKAIADEYNASLVVMNTDGSRAYAIQDMGSNADLVDINWSPSGQFVALSRTGPAQAGFGRRAVLLIDQDGEAPGSIIVDGTNFSSKWNPTGSHLLYSTSDVNQRDRPGLWYVKASGQDIGTERKPLDVATWAEKCTFKNDTFLLCAVPREIKDYEGFTPYFNNSIDDLYEINVLSGRKKLLAQPTITARMFNLTLSEDRSTMYFTDQSGRLNYLLLE